MSGARHRLGAILGVALSVACAPGAPPRPAGAAIDDPAAVAALTSVTRHCRPLRTSTLELRLSGRAGTQSIRARLLAGFAEPASLRLEALAPFGPPGLILASDGTSHTLYFPRDRQVLRDAPVASVLEALAGLSLDAAELRHVVLGCLAGSGGQGRRYGDQWQEVVDSEARVFLRRGVVVAATYRGWDIDYAEPLGGIARRVRVRRRSADVPLDLTAVLADVEVNVDLALSR
jgi:hypothetical protein